MGVGRVASIGLIGLGLLVAPARAHADAPATIDWATGMVTARGIGIADRQAPNPAVARGTSRRKAEDAAKRALAAALPALPLATGGTLGDKLTDHQVKARIDRAVERAIPIEAEPETDGAWQVTMAVPIEAVRQALTGPRTLPATGDAGPPVVIVDGVTAKPALGFALGTTSAATLWVKEAPAWAKGAPHLKAKRETAGVIDVDVGKATEATLFVITAAR